ncbi:MAG: DUF883 domain-containing protein [Deltaproteobacteria bacterium]|nr:DUF883 domain-containing protein [Deltaproteobacteria bacterium]
MSMTRPETETMGEVEQITMKKLMEDLKTVVNDAEGLLKKAASDQTREWISAVQSKAKKSLKAANDWLTEEEEAVAARTRSAAKATKDYVRANTWMVLGMAAITGLVVGILAIRLGQTAIEEGKTGQSRP